MRLGLARVWPRPVAGWLFCRGASTRGIGIIYRICLTIASRCTLRVISIALTAADLSDLYPCVARQALLYTTAQARIW